MIYSVIDEYDIFYAQEKGREAEYVEKLQYADNLPAIDLVSAKQITSLDKYMKGPFYNEYF